MALTIDIPAFARNAPIPDQFARQGANISPRVEWHDAPLDTRSFALIVEDPDSPKGMFRHWAAYDIPPDASSLHEGAGSGTLGAPIKMARNDFGDTRYDGPQPPTGHGTHHYHFRLFALDTPQLEVPEDADAKQILDAAMEHSIAEAETVGTFER
jgi:Raf kinase inhibitor-like YbhB/YbcL family protein